MSDLHPNVIKGRGLAYRDAITVDENGKVSYVIDTKCFRPGTFRMMALGTIVYPVIVYDESEEKQLCIAFQVVKEDGRYHDVNIASLMKSLSMILKHRGNCDE